MVNKVILVGNVGKDPVMHTTGDGRKIARFSIATSERWRDKDTGERKEKTEWHNIVVFNENLAKVVEQYVKRGSKLYVEGSMATRKYEKDGVTHYNTEVVPSAYRGEITLLDKSEGGGRPTPDESDYGTTRSRDDYGNGSRGKPSARNDMDDEIPFAPEFR
ncbi:single-stranded DNA-binding protein [Bradyrhizobium sp. Leo121]|uniref:single-stranded DNA-binding protein n=1 Tax=Bradyrhizobium sp. Leo121 TaxID=1571195 RepID=UPI001FE18BA9|nr:single-stranded DNA-binding protein [Bradyrhizobium sp. Leo121]